MEGSHLGNEHNPSAEALNARFGRRRFLGVLAAVGGAALAAPLLAACGSDDEDPTATAGSGAEGTPTSGGGAEGSPTAGGGTDATATEGSGGDQPTTPPDSGSGEVKRGGKLKWYLPDDPPDLDPHMQTTSSLQWVCGMCYNGLLRFDVGPGNGPESVEASTPIPDLAESYEVSDDGLTYVFTIRQGVKFHDGNTLTTGDVAFSLNRIRSEGPEFQRSYAFTPVESVEATDDTTVTVTMVEPYAAFINQVAVAYTRIAPQAVIEENGDMKQIIDGTGPFKLESYQRGQKMVVVRNEDYWEEGIPYLDSVEMTIMPDNSTSFAAFTAGQLDIYTPLNYAQIDSLTGTNPDVVVNEWAAMGMNGIGCNTAVEPFNDVRVRQALFIAINQEQIIQIAHANHGFKQRAVPVAMTDWVVPYDELPLSAEAPDTDAAKALLAEAGFPDGFDVQIKTVVRYTQEEATVVAEQLKTIGVNMEILDVEYGAYLEARNNGDFSLIAFALSPFGDIEDFTTALYHTEASRNYGDWGNAELDEILNSGRSELDVPARQEIFKEAQVVIAENCWIVDLARGTALEVWQPYVMDYPSAQNPERGLAFWRAWLNK